MSMLLRNSVFFTILMTAFSMFGKAFTQTRPNADGEMAQKVYRKLQDAIGDKEANWPNLIVWSVENRGAVFVPGENSIYLDEKLILSCKTLDGQMEDALAFVIAHEMTHFYQSHQWQESGLVRNFMVSSLEFKMSRQNEAEADIYGAFISYQAGYNTLRLIPDLLDRIYEAYDLDDTANSQYPSLEERKDLALESCYLAENLIEMYQMANYLMVLGRYEAAYHLYKYVGNNIQFKELHYNLGICNMMAYWHVQKIELKYPLIIDSWSPIQRGLIDRSPQQLLAEARTSFERIIEKYDSTYIPARIHLISIFDWLGEIQKAEELINRYNGISEINSSSLFGITAANFYIRQGQIAKGQSLYQSTLESSQTEQLYYRDLIDYNRAILQNEIPSSLNSRNQVIKNERGLDNVSSLIFYQDFQHSITMDQDLLFRFGQEFNSTVSKLETAKSKFTLQRITSSDIKTSGGLGIGESFNNIEGQISHELMTTWPGVQGSYIIIFQKGLIFKLDNEGIIEEWVSFSM